MRQRVPAHWPDSPLLSWVYQFLDTRSFSNLIGVLEISTGILISLHYFSPKLSALGSIGGAITFLITLSFMFSTPGTIQQGMSFPFISGLPGQFLIKDILLFGASLWTAGKALATAGKQTTIKSGQPI